LYWCDLTNFPSTAHIALTGPIGAGKTTLGKQIEQALRQAGHTVVFSEEILSDAVVHLLELSNAEPQRYMELFQTVMLMRAAVRQTALGDQGIIIAERPLEESWVFGRANLALGRLSQEYFDQVYRPLHAEYKSPIKQLIIYLYVCRATAAKRIAQRNRSGEATYGDAYLDALEDAYFDWVVDCCSQGRMLVVDWITPLPAEQLLARIDEALKNPTQLIIAPQHKEESSDPIERRRAHRLRLANIAHLHAVNAGHL